MENKPLNFLIGDAQPKVRFGLRLLLEQQSGWKVTGEAEDAMQLLDHIRLGCPDLVLLDWELPGKPVLTLLAMIRQACPHLWVVFMSSNDELRRPALQAGADIFAYKADPPEKLLALIQKLTIEKSKT
jgi:DNA-binding NarL/FixJ family response regulator